VLWWENSRGLIIALYFEAKMNSIRTLPAVNNQWSFSIFGLALTNSLNERNQCSGKLWDAMVWPASEEEVFNFQRNVTFIFFVF